LTEVEGGNEPRVGFGEDSQFGGEGICSNGDVVPVAVPVSLMWRLKRADHSRYNPHHQNICRAMAKGKT